MNREPTRIEELKGKLAMAQDDLSIRTAELERAESERDALKAQLAHPAKTEVTAEEWLKATALELCRVADYFLALRQNTMEVVSAATQVNADASRLEWENIDLRARVKRLEEAADAYVAVPCGCVCDGPCGHAEVYTNWIKAKETK